MRRMWPGGSRPSPGRFDPTWEEIACAAVDVGGARREKKSAYLCRMCAPMRSSFHNFVTHSLSHTTFTHTIFHTHHLSHTTLPHTLFHTRLSHTPSFFATHHLSHTILSHTFYLSILQHLLRLSFRPRPATTWKKLTCGVIRSFNSHEIWENPGDNFQKMKPVFT